MKALTSEQVLKQSTDNLSLVRTGNSNFPTLESKAATERTGGDLDLDTDRQTKYVYTCSGVKDLIENLQESVESLKEYADPGQIVVYATPPLNSNDIEKLIDLNVDVRLRPNFSRKVTVHDFGEPSHFSDKFYITEVEAENVIFLDCDTLVFNNPKALIDGDFKFASLLTSRSKDESWQNSLRTLFEKEGVEGFFEREPSTGFMIFKDNFHKQVRESLSRFLKSDLRSKGLEGIYAHDQYAMSLALGENGLNISSDDFKELDRTDHCYGAYYKDNQDIDIDEITVFHKSDNQKIDFVGRTLLVLDKLPLVDFDKINRKIRGGFK